MFDSIIILLDFAHEHVIRTWSGRDDKNNSEEEPIDMLHRYYSVLLPFASLYLHRLALIIYEQTLGPMSRKTRL